MTEKNRLKPFPEEIIKKSGPGFVRKVAVLAANPLFEGPRIRAVAQQGFIVIEFKDQSATALQTLLHQTCRDAKVGCDTDAPFPAFNDKTGRCDGIMGQRNRFNTQITKIDDLAG